MWEAVWRHVQGHLTHRVSLTTGSLLSSDSSQVKESLQDSWLNSAPASKCISIGELLQCTQMVHSHTENARCLQYHQALDCLAEQGFEPAVNSKRYLIAELTTKPGVLRGDMEGQRRVLMESTGESLQLQDDTGSVQCQLSFCHWNWLGQVLMVPCWNFIPGADRWAPGHVEICPQCTPVAVTQRAQPSPGILSTIQTMSVTTAAKLLNDHHRTKGKQDQISVTGKVIAKSPMIRIHGKPLFFFKLVSATSGKESISLLAKGKNFVFLYSAVRLNETCTVTHLTPTSILKGTKHSYRVLLCRKESAVLDVTNTGEDSSSLRGTVTKVIDASSGIYELDDKIRLHLCYQMDETAGYQPLRPGCTLRIHNAHHQQQSNKSQAPRIICCMQSTVSILTFSPLDTGPWKIPCPPLSGMVRLLLKMNSTVTCLDWLTAVMSQLEKKFSPDFVRKRDLHAVLFRLFNTASALSQKPLLSGRKRNIYEEFLNASHSCLASEQLRENKSAVWQFPDVAELAAVCGRQGETPSPSVWGQRGDSTVGNSTAASRDMQYRLDLSTQLKPPMILLGYLHLNPRTGMLQLRDQTGCMDCLVADVSTLPGRQRSAGDATVRRRSSRLAAARHTPSSDVRRRTPARRRSGSEEASSDVSRSRGARCSLPRLRPVSAGCLGHLLRLEGFLVVREVDRSPSRGRSSPGHEAVARHSLDAREEGQPDESEPPYLAFSMQSAECLFCSVPSTDSAQRSTGSLATEHQKSQDRAQSDKSLKNNRSEDPRLQDVDPGEELSQPVPESGKLDCQDCDLFLVLNKSGILMSGAGAGLAFICRIVTLDEVGSSAAATGNRDDGNEPEKTPRQAFVRFSGEPVRWHSVLHSGCAYRMRGETRTVSKAEFWKGIPSSAHSSLDENSSLYLTASAECTLIQLDENVICVNTLEKLQSVRDQFASLLHVSSVQEILDLESTSADLCVSFQGIIVARQQGNKVILCHPDKKRRKSPEQQMLRAGDEIQLLVADSMDCSLTLNVYMHRSLLQNVLGLLPGSRVTFRQCRRDVDNDLLCCYVTPQASVTVDGISIATNTSRNSQDCAKSDTQRDTETDPPTDKPDPRTEPAISPTADCQPMSRPLTSTTPARRLHLYQLIASPDLVSRDEVFTVACHLQAIYSLVLKWSCSHCGHKDCVCSAEVASSSTGELTAHARFAVEDGSSEAIVRCTDDSSIAVVLGLTGYQWNQLSLAVKSCNEVTFTRTYKKWDSNQQPEKPADSDTEGLVNLLCSHSSIQKPLELQCCRVGQWKDRQNAASHQGESCSEYMYAPSVQLKCLTAQSPAWSLQ